MVQLLWKTAWRFLTKLKMGQPYDSAIPLLFIQKNLNQDLKEMSAILYSLNPNHSSLNVETTLISINRRMDKENVVCTYNRTNFAICNKMNET